MDHTKGQRCPGDGSISPSEVEDRGETIHPEAPGQRRRRRITGEGGEEEEEEEEAGK